VFATSHRVCPLGERGKALAAADMPIPKGRVKKKTANYPLFVDKRLTREILILIQPFKHTVPSGFLIHL
jgi:hypothetical protein